MDDPISKLYPELAAVESMSALIRSRHDLPQEVTVTGFEEYGGSRLWAELSSSKRGSSVTVAVEERAFLVVCSEGGVNLAHLSTRSLDVVIRALDGWHVQGSRVGEMQSELPDVSIRDGAQEYESGPSEFVAYRWHAIQLWLEQSDPSLCLALAADDGERLRGLMPVRTMAGLAFSSCTGDPHVRGPVIGEAVNGRHRVSFREVVSDGHTASEAVGRAIQLLPSDFGPAQHGTATSLAGPN